jgi:hypothetical protein
VLRVRTLVEESMGIKCVVMEVSDTAPVFLRAGSGCRIRECRRQRIQLFITHEILNHHGGHLEVKSRRPELP